jgi:hypothetical protein
MNIHVVQKTVPWRRSLEIELQAIAADALDHKPVEAVMRLRALIEIAEQLNTEDLIGLAAVVSNGRSQGKHR